MFPGSQNARSEGCKAYSRMARACCFGIPAGHLLLQKLACSHIQQLGLWPSANSIGPPRSLSPDASSELLFFFYLNVSSHMQGLK